MARRSRRRRGASPLLNGRTVAIVAGAAALASVFEAAPAVASVLVLAVPIILALRWWNRREAGRATVRSLAELLALTPTGFEEDVAARLRNLGYRNVRRVGGSGDLGADVRATDPAGRSVVVQCKRYAPGNNVGSPDMQRFLGTIHHYRADRGLFATTAAFTPPARAFAEQHGIELVDGPALVRLGEWAAPAATPARRVRPVALGAGLLGALAVAVVVDRTADPNAPSPSPAVTARLVATLPPASIATATARQTRPAPSTVAPVRAGAVLPTRTPRPARAVARATATPRPTQTPRAQPTPRPTRTPAAAPIRPSVPSPTPGAGRLGLAAVPDGIPERATWATVAEVIDGDTLAVVVGGRTERVRLIGIDTPETRDPNDPVECFGAEATARTERMLPPGRAVWLERDVSDRDRDDRLLRYVWFAGRDDGGANLANELLVREGFAVAGTDQPDSRYADRFASAQRAARVLDRGLWAECGGADTPLGGSMPSPTPRATRTPRPTPTRSLRPTPTPRPSRLAQTPVAPTGDEPPFPAPAEPTPVPAGGGCDPSYPGVCIPPAPPDLDCGEVGYVGFAVVGADPHGFDRDGDGVGCEG